MIVVTGANGFIGGEIAAHLAAKGHDIVAVSRTPDRAAARLPKYRWIGVEGDALERAIAESGRVVNMAGIHPFARRWTSGYKRQVYETRVGFTSRVVKALSASKAKDKVLVCASSTLCYGDCGDEWVPEETANPARTFLQCMLRDWEIEMAKAAGTRWVALRIGLALKRGLGAMAVLEEKKAATLGSGEQFAAWVHSHDVSRFAEAALSSPKWQGAYNVAAPEPVRMKDMMGRMARCLGLPKSSRVPRFLVKLLVGEASEILLTGCRARPKRALELGFQFECRTIDECFALEFPGKSAAAA